MNASNEDGENLWVFFVSSIQQWRGSFDQSPDSYKIEGNTGPVCGKIRFYCIRKRNGLFFCNLCPTLCTYCVVYMSAWLGMHNFCLLRHSPDALSGRLVGVGEEVPGSRWKDLQLNWNRTVRAMKPTPGLLAAGRIVWSDWFGWTFSSCSSWPLSLLLLVLWPIRYGPANVYRFGK